MPIASPYSIVSRSVQEKCRPSSLRSSTAGYWIAMDASFLVALLRRPVGIDKIEIPLRQHDFARCNGGGQRMGVELFWRNDPRTNLHPDLADIATASQKRLARLLARQITDHVQQHWSDALGRKDLLVLVRHHAVDQLAGRRGRDRPDPDTVLQPFLSKRIGESPDTRLRSTVVGLAELAP